MYVTTRGGNSPAGDGVDDRGPAHPGSVRHVRIPTSAPVRRGTDDVRNDKEAILTCALERAPRWRRNLMRKGSCSSPRGTMPPPLLRRGWPPAWRPGPGPPPPLLTDRYTVTSGTYLHWNPPKSAGGWQVIARHVFDSKATMTASCSHSGRTRGPIRLGAVLQLRTFASQWSSPGPAPHRHPSRRAGEPAAAFAMAAPARRGSFWPSTDGCCWAVGRSRPGPRLQRLESVKLAPVGGGRRGGLHLDAAALPPEPTRPARCGIACARTCFSSS
jgi:hypothetical protein